MKKIKSLALAALIAASAPVASMAVPAYPGLIKVTQPDGTTVSIKKIGDEFGHYITTSDGHMLIKENNAYYYATAADGMIVSSGIAAAEPEMRTAAAKSFLASVDTSALAKVASKNAERSTMRRITDGTQMLTNRSFPVTGKPKALLVLVEFTDVKFVNDDPLTYLTDLARGENFTANGATGSVRDYYLSSSNGQLDLDFDVFGVIQLSNNQKYYGANTGYSGQDVAAYKMAVEALQALDADHDLSIYDGDGDGYIDNITVIYAGEGEATSDNENSVWPHSFDAWDGYPQDRYEFDGVKFNHYLVVNEWNAALQTMEGIGVFTHEFGHALGLPDLYATSYANDDLYYATPGAWSVMDRGSYNNNTRTPPLFSCYEAYCMGWSAPEKLTPGTYSLPGNGEYYVIETDKPNDFFLLENRTKENKWNRYLPGEGLLVWHIDYAKSYWNRNTVNNTLKHQRIDIVEADNNYKSKTHNAFPGRNGRVTEFTPSSDPQLISWSGYKPEIGLTNIAKNADTKAITFTVESYGAGIEDVEAEATDIPAEYFNLQGTRIVNPTKGQIVIVRRGDKVSKQIF